LGRRVLIIANPAAGRAGPARRRLARVVAALRHLGCGVVVRHAGGPGDVERLARAAAAEFEVVVAAGGDGTVNAVANGLAGTPQPFAVLPLGTANVLACEIGLPREAERLAAVIAAGPARPIWPGRVGDRLFLEMASSGFDAMTVAAVAPRLKRHLGRIAFAWAIFGCLMRYRACDLVVEIGGAEYRVAAAVAAKGRCYAGRYVIAPRASLAEPWLDLVLFQRSGRLAVLRYLAALLRGRLPRRADIAIVRCREAVVSGDARLPVQADGEIVGHLPMRIAIADRPLYLVQP
jgi:diacylglycerol kinase (ATP)